VVRRWGRLFPPRDKSRRPLAVSDDWVQGHLTNVAWVVQARKRLQSLSWFMKCLKEPLSRLANREDQTRGAFLRGGSKILDRLGSTAEEWQARLEKLRQGRFLGRYFATTPDRLREVAQRLGVKRVPNLGGCPAS